MSLLPACVPLPPVLVVTVPPEVVAAQVATADRPGEATPTEATTPATVDDTTTTSETTPETTTTSEPEPPSTTVPPDTTVPPSDPGQSGNAFAAP
jgi:hypothetical protein